MRAALCILFGTLLWANAASAAVPLVPHPAPGLRAPAAELLRDVSKDAERMRRTIAPGDVRPIEVHVHPNPRALRKAAPGGVRLPRHALGVAYPDLRRVDVSLSGHAGALPMAPQTLLLHEIAHVLVSDAASGKRVPRWLTEGIAVYFSGEFSFDRFGALASAVHGGRIRSVRTLSAGFGGRDHEVSAAYAQAASFVAYLVEEDGPGAIRDLLRRLGEGETIDDALTGAYATPVAAIDRDFRRVLEDRYRLWPALTGTGALWGTGAILLVAAWARRRRQKDRPWPDEDPDDAEIGEEGRAELENSPVSPQG